MIPSIRDLPLKLPWAMPRPINSAKGKDMTELRIAILSDKRIAEVSAGVIKNAGIKAGVLII